MKSNLAVLYERLTPIQRELYDKALESSTVPTKTTTQTANLGGDMEHEGTEELPDGTLKELKSPRAKPAKIWLNARTE